MVIELPDGYNGHTAKFHSDPIETDGELVKLRCAEPGKEYLIKWAYRSQVEDVVDSDDSFDLWLGGM